MCCCRDQRRQLPSVAHSPKAFPKLLGTFAAQTLAERYDADPSAADWRRFGRLPGFTNCKPKYKKRRPLPLRASGQPHRTAVPDGPGLRARDNEVVRDPRARTRGPAVAKFSF